MRERYDGVLHLVSAADGAPEAYKYGIVEDDSGGQVARRPAPTRARPRAPARPAARARSHARSRRHARSRPQQLACALSAACAPQVYRRETPAEAIEIDRKLQGAWAAHATHVVVGNGAGGFGEKLATATEAVLRIAREAHPAEWDRAQQQRGAARPHATPPAPPPTPPQRAAPADARPRPAEPGTASGEGGAARTGEGAEGARGAGATAAPVKPTAAPSNEQLQDKQKEECRLA